MNSNNNQLINFDAKLILASASPRRRFLLSLIGLNFQTISVDIDESNYSSVEPKDIVCELAERKSAIACKLYPDDIVITADTLVFLDNKILTKPRDPGDAYRILKLLSGRTHQVFTGIAISQLNKGVKIIDFEKTNVTFRNLDDNEILAYVRTGSPMDKAGAYGIQDDFGAVFVERINGDYYNVVGLPLCKVYSILKSISIPF